MRELFEEIRYFLSKCEWTLQDSGSIHTHLLHYYYVHCTYMIIFICLLTSDDLLNLDSLLIQLKPEVTSKWEQFAQVIGLSEDVMKDLASCGPDDRMVEMLDYWLRHNPSKPTWRDVAQVLEEIHLYQLADDLLKVYDTGTYIYAMSTSISVTLV